MDPALDLTRRPPSQAHLRAKALYSTDLLVPSRRQSWWAGSMATHGFAHLWREKSRAEKPPKQATRQIAKLLRASAPPHFQNFVLLVCFRDPPPQGGTRTLFRRPGTCFRRPAEFARNRRRIRWKVLSAETKTSFDSCQAKSSRRTDRMRKFVKPLPTKEICAGS